MKGGETQRGAGTRGRCLRKAEDPGVMQRRRKGRGGGGGVVRAAEAESEGLKNRGKGDKPGEGGSWDKGEGGPGRCGGGARTQGERFTGPGCS